MSSFPKMALRRAPMASPFPGCAAEDTVILDDAMVDAATVVSMSEALVLAVAGLGHSSGVQTFEW